MSRNNQLIFLGLAAAALASVVVVWFAFSDKKEKSKEVQNDDTDVDDLKKSKSLASTSTEPSDPTTKSTTPSSPPQSTDEPPPLSANPVKSESLLNERIEALDQQGKRLFKDQKYMEAARVFTEALDLVEQNTATATTAANPGMIRQRITLRYNRSAVYEKANELDLAMDDCYAILEQNAKHNKARARLLRVLETSKRYYDALVQVCAMQLLFMQENRDKIRANLPISSAPVPQTKIEELISQLIPDQLQQLRQRGDTKTNSSGTRVLPTDLTILQLLKSFSSYNAWMSKAAKDGNVETISLQLQAENISASDKASVLMKRGRRHVYDKNYAKACDDFEEAFQLVEASPELQAAMPDDDWNRLLEWVATERHWQYQLESALECFQRCSNLEPDNVELLVKQAGVLQDASRPDEALAMLDKALSLDSNSVDAYFHRGNLNMVQQKYTEAKADLERCLDLRPGHVQARLRLVPLFMSAQDIAGAEQMLDLAERLDPKAAEVPLYRGELCFLQGQVEQAKECFEKAIALEPRSPQPYANAAAAVLNIQPTTPGSMPDLPEAIRLLQKSIEVDSQFHQAYVQLGQLMLGTATDLNAARQVIKLYDQGIENCRVEEDIKTLCGMRILTVAQVEAATSLKMETFSMQ